MAGIRRGPISPGPTGRTVQSPSLPTAAVVNIPIRDTTAGLAGALDTLNKGTTDILRAKLAKETDDTQEAKVVGSTRHGSMVEGQSGFDLRLPFDVKQDGSQASKAFARSVAATYANDVSKDAETVLGELAGGLPDNPDLFEEKALEYRNDLARVAPEFTREAILSDFDHQLRTQAAALRVQKAKAERAGAAQKMLAVVDDHFARGAKAAQAGDIEGVQIAIGNWKRLKALNGSDEDGSRVFSPEEEAKLDKEFIDTLHAAGAVGELLRGETRLLDFVTTRPEGMSEAAHAKAMADYTKILTVQNREAAAIDRANTAAVKADQAREYAETARGIRDGEITDADYIFDRVADGRLETGKQTTLLSMLDAGEPPLDTARATLQMLEANKRADTLTHEMIDEHSSTISDADFKKYHAILDSEEAARDDENERLIRIPIFGTDDLTKMLSPNAQMESLQYQAALADYRQRIAAGENPSLVTEDIIRRINKVGPMGQTIDASLAGMRAPLSDRLYPSTPIREDSGKLNVKAIRADIGARILADVNSGRLSQEDARAKRDDIWEAWQPFLAADGLGAPPMPPTETSKWPNQ